MELKDYTDEELRSELKRRAKERHSAASKGRCANYNYALAKITWMSDGPFVRREYEATITEEEYERMRYEINHKTFRIRSLNGFNKSTAPQVGDMVILKGRVSRHDKTGFMWGNVYLDKVLKSSNNETSETQGQDSQH